MTNWFDWLSVSPIRRNPTNAKPVGYWRNQDHQRAFFVNVARQLGFNPENPRNWNSVTKAQIIDAVKSFHPQRLEFIEATLTHSIEGWCGNTRVFWWVSSSSFDEGLSWAALCVEWHFVLEGKAILQEYSVDNLWKNKLVNQQVRTRNWTGWVLAARMSKRRLATTL